MSTNFSSNTETNSSEYSTAALINSNPYITTPVTFNIQRSDSGTLLVFHKLLDSRTKMEKSNDDAINIAGSIVSNPQSYGASAQVIPTTGTCNGGKSQRMWLKALSPSTPTVLATIDFSSPSESSSDDDEENLTMTITNGLLPPTQDSAQSDSSITIPLIVGPGSTVIGSIDDSSLEALADLGISWGSIWDVAKTVMPVVAKSGYEIYQELTSSDSLDAPCDDIEGFLATVGSIAKIAAPIAGTLLASLI